MYIKWCEILQWDDIVHHSVTCFFLLHFLLRSFLKFLFWNNHRFTRSCKNSMIPYTLHPVSVKWMLLITAHQNQEISTCVDRSMHPITHVDSYNHDHNQDTDLESIWDLASSRHQFHSNSYKNFLKKRYRSISLPQRSPSCYPFTVICPPPFSSLTSTKSWQPLQNIHGYSIPL